jgi:hypothetical protein
MNRFLSLALLPLLLALPSAAQACSVCGGGTEDNRMEFIITTAVLTFLPLGMMFGIFWYFRGRYLAVANQVPQRDEAGMPIVARSEPIDA